MRLEFLGVSVDLWHGSVLSCSLFSSALHWLFLPRTGGKSGSVRLKRGRFTPLWRQSWRIIRPWVSRFSTSISRGRETGMRHLLAAIARSLGTFPGPTLDLPELLGRPRWRLEGSM